MLWDAVAYAALGLVAALLATRLLPGRLPRSPLVLATGPVAALAGGFVTRTIFGAGRLDMALLGALVVAVILLSLLARPGRPSPLA